MHSFSWASKIGQISNFLVAVLAAVLIGAVGCELDRRDIRIVDTYERYFGSYPIAYAHPRGTGQNQDVIVVSVTDQTLEKYEYLSPTDRLLLAQLISEIDSAQPKAIGLLFVWDRKTSKDEELLQIIRNAKSPVVLAESSDLSLAYQSVFLSAAQRPFGHANLEGKNGVSASDRKWTVYGASGPLRVRAGDERLTSSFSEVLLASVNGSRRVAVGKIPYVRKLDDYLPYIAEIHVPSHEPIEKVINASVLLRGGVREFIKNKIVIVSRHREGDEVATPLSVLDGSISVAQVHAQAVAQVLNKSRGVLEWPWWISQAIVSCVALVCICSVFYIGLNALSFMYGLMGLTLIACFSFLSFKYLRLELPSVALTVAWLAGGLLGSLQRRGIRHFIQVDK